MPDDQPYRPESENAKEDLAYRTAGTLVDLCVGDPFVIPLPDRPIVQGGIEPHPEETNEEEPDILLNGTEIKGIDQQILSKQENECKSYCCETQEYQTQPKEVDCIVVLFGEAIGEFIAEDGADTKNCQYGRVYRKNTQVSRRIEACDDRHRDDTDQLGDRGAAPENEYAFVERIIQDKLNRPGSIGAPLYDRDQV